MTIRHKELSVGRPVLRFEDERVLRGQARYLDDLHLPGEAHVAFVRSPFARARIGGITKPEGALHVLTAADLPPETAPLPVRTPEGAETADELCAALERAFAEPGPHLIDAILPSRL